MIDAPPFDICPLDNLDRDVIEQLETSDLSGEQREVAREIIETKHNILITGNAGVGKTHLLKWLRSRIDMSVTASTGIAAIHIKGSTIHSWAGLGIGKLPAAKILANLEEKAVKYRDKTLSRMQDCNRLVIDEISMLDADMLNLLDEVLRGARSMVEPFGGVQMVLIGDFLQLPPVTRSGKPKFAFKADSWIRAGVQVRLLTHVFRQEDREFSGILNKIRFDECDDEVSTFLAARHAAKDEDPEHPPCILHTHNRGCEKTNLEELAKLDGEAVTYEADETHKHEAFQKQLNKECLAPRKLTLKVGARVMLLANLDLSKGLANGTLGIVECVDGEPRIQFDNGKTVDMEKSEYELIKGEDTLATRSQYPLRLAWAITIHKSQGMTIPKVEAHLKRCFAEGQSYVALSRASTVEGLFLRGGGVNISAHPEAVKFYREHCEA